MSYSTTPAKITDISAITPGDNVVVIAFDDETPRSITNATVVDITDTTFTLRSSTAEPLGDAVRGSAVNINDVEYFTHIGKNGTIHAKGTKPNVYSQRGTYLYDAAHPITSSLVEWANYCITAHSLHANLAQSAAAIRLSNNAHDVQDLYDIREIIDEIIAEEEHARTAKQELQQLLAVQQRLATHD